MRSIFRLLLPALAVIPLAYAQEQGFTAEWDIRAILKEISAHAGRLVPVLDKAEPARWMEKGAPDTYLSQWKTLKAQAQALSTEALELSRNPEKLSPALKTFFRMQSLEFMVGSFVDGIRKYQGPSLAQELAGLAAENGANRERFQRYIVELAAERQQEYEIMDHEAQRCRTILSNQAPLKPARAGRK